MLSYKEYKLLNESLYGAFNLGLKSHGTVGGIVSASGVNGTEAALEAEAEEAIEEAKKMKKKMDGEEDMEDEDEVEDDVHSDEDEEGDDDSDEDSEDDEEGDEDSEEEEEGEDEEEEKEFAFMKNKMKNKMKKKSKKEWSEVMSDLEEVLEAIEDEAALTEVKKGLEMMKKGMEKGCGCGKTMDKKCGKYMSEGKKAHKTACECPVCEKKKDNDEEDKGDDEGEGLTAGQKKLPKALQDAILAKKGGKDGKKCGKNMNEEEAKWWKSVNEMLGADPNQKNWDGGWSEVGEVEQAVREGEQLDEVLGLDTPDYSGKPGVMSRIVQSPLNAFKRVSGVQSHTLKAYMKSAHEKAVEVALARVLGKKQEADELEKELRSTYTDHPDAEDHVGSQHTLSNDIWAKTEHIKEYMKQGMSPYEAAQKVAKSVAMFSR